MHFKVRTRLDLPSINLNANRKMAVISQSIIIVSQGSHFAVIEWAFLADSTFNGLRVRASSPRAVGSNLAGLRTKALWTRMAAQTTSLQIALL